MPKSRRNEDVDVFFNRLGDEMREGQPSDVGDGNTI